MEHGARLELLITASSRNCLQCRWKHHLLAGWLLYQVLLHEHMLSLTLLLLLALELQGRHNMGGGNGQKSATKRERNAAKLAAPKGACRCSSHWCSSLSAAMISPQEPVECSCLATYATPVSSAAVVLPLQQCSAEKAA